MAGSARRVGMSDLFHCFDGCARKVWDGHAAERREARRLEARQLEQDSDTDESSQGEDAVPDLAPDHPDALPLVAWASVCRRLRGILGRGQGSFHLQNAYARCGIHWRLCIRLRS